MSGKHRILNHRKESANWSVSEKSIQLYKQVLWT